jgi:SAM-dependent methyltransferase
MQAYWDARFRLEGRVWGDAPSRTAEYAREAFAREGLRTVLVPGAGYGRNAALFAAAGFRVVGVEISPEALRLARRGAASEAYVRGTVLALPICRCDAIYCFNVLHLLRLPERKQLVAACRACLAEGGLAFFAVFSEREPSYGRGREVEKDTYESKPGRPVHYFTDADLRARLAGWTIRDTGLMEDSEDHGEEGPHTHVVRYILASPPSHAEPAAH